MRPAAHLGCCYTCVHCCCTACRRVHATAVRRSVLRWLHEGLGLSLQQHYLQGSFEKRADTCTICRLTIPTSTVKASETLRFRGQPQSKSAFLSPPLFSFSLCSRSPRFQFLIIFIGRSAVISLRNPPSTCPPYNSYRGEPTGEYRRPGGRGQGRPSGGNLYAPAADTRPAGPRRSRLRLRGCCPHTPVGRVGRRGHRGPQTAVEAEESSKASPAEPPASRG